MMAMLKKMTINKKPKEEWSAEDKLFAETYGGKIDFVDRNSITPIVEYVKALNAFAADCLTAARQFR
jgi:hypothetical protein